MAQMRNSSLYPRYLTIEPKILTTEPENSFIVIAYTYFDTDINQFK